MARKRKGRPVHGWIVIDKPKGMSSSAVVGRVRRALDAEKAGHGGTLDPLATGVLPIALGEATKTVSFVMDGVKGYRCWVRFGSATSTDDAEGEVIETSDVRPTRAEIEAVLAEFTGDVVQVPPAFSALKVDGRRAYTLARAGEEVEMKPRTVRIDAVTLADMPADDLAVVDVACGKGTYIRALARDLARRLGTVGHVADLRRTRSGPFRESGAISLDSLEALGHSAPLEEIVLPILTALDDIPALALTEDEAGNMRHGMAVPANAVLARAPGTQAETGKTVVVVFADTPVALARIEDGQIRPVRVLNL
ncbi:MAG: tRNA pseudouridine(55) synthase TruB [Alphaproteobacteria bacterium]|nr:tRNA pseudouridine(55) synthase TruB [Alphaproteobacteria bacterium]MBF0250939.1 tRNA pseudouridine(55) synthase TruB [Alphaproteobacteria bacterium]